MSAQPLPTSGAGTLPEHPAERRVNRSILGSATHRIAIDRRRWLQLALAAIWIVDGLLQFQPFMFTGGFAKMFVGIRGGSPDWILASIHWAWTVVAMNPILTNTAFATLQVLLGVGIIWRRSLKLSLTVSILWSLIVWWFGEDLGGLFSGDASALSGAPGAVLLYAVLAALLWPTERDTSRTFVAAQPVGPRVAKATWLVLWVGLAALNLQPANLQPGSVSSTVSAIGDGQPAWLSALTNGFAGLSAHSGDFFALIGAVIMALIGVGILVPARWTRVTIATAVTASAFIWLIGQALGALFGGTATDVNSGPLLAIIALAYWPVRPKAPSGVTQGTRT
jgi:hypothetical protein